MGKPQNKINKRKIIVTLNDVLGLKCHHILVSCIYRYLITILFIASQYLLMAFLQNKTTKNTFMFYKCWFYYYFICRPSRCIVRHLS